MIKICSWFRNKKNLKVAKLLILCGCIGLVGIALAEYFVKAAVPSLQVDNTEFILNMPIGLAAESNLTSVKLAWVNQPGSNVLVYGYLVYYWQTELGFENVTLATENPIKEQSFEIKNLLPATEYTFSVRAVTLIGLGEKSEQYGKYFLSKFSKEFKVKTRSDTKFELINGNVIGSVIKISKYTVSKAKWTSSEFFVLIGEQLGSVINISGEEVDFRSDYTLVEVKAIFEQIKKLENRTFTDPQNEEGINIPFPSNSTSNLIVFRAKLKNTAGEVIFIYSQ